MEIPENVKTIDWDASTIWFDEDGIMYSTPKPGIVEPELSRSESLERMEEFKKITGHKKVCMILETNSHSKPPKKEDRDFISEQLSEITKAMAIISSSPLSRMIANLFFGLKPPAYPVKFFSSQKEAKEWIMQYLED
jgi:hypothetical protein